jgi:hypothetical protein
LKKRKLKGFLGSALVGYPLDAPWAWDFRCTGIKATLNIKARPLKATYEEIIISKQLSSHQCEV